MTGVERDDDASWDWSRIVPRYSNLVLSIPRKKGLSSADAEDVFQSTWLTAIRKRPVPPPPDEIVRFLAAITYWEVRGLWRRRKLGQLPEGVAEIRISGQPPPDAEIERLENAQRLYEAMQELSERDRELLVFFHFSGPETPPYGDVAERFGVSVNSVGGMLARARARLEGVLRGGGFP